MSGADIDDTQWKWVCNYCGKIMEWMNSPCDCSKAVKRQQTRDLLALGDPMEVLQRGQT